MKKSVPILLARFRFHKIHALLEAHRSSKLTPPKRKKLKFCAPALYRSLGCPLCSELLDVFRRPMGDEWSYCPECGFADDVPGTVAVSLGCTLEEAVEFLVFQHNLHHVSKKEIDRYLAEKARYDRFAELVKERLYRDYSLGNPDADHGLPDKTLYRLLGTLNLRSQIGGEPECEYSLTKKDRIIEPQRQHDYRDTDPRQSAYVPTRQLPSLYPTDFFGFTYAHVVESWFFPHLYNPETKKVWANTSPTRLFHGRDWSLVIVIPLKDVPGRFCGVLCIGREGRYPRDYVIRLFHDYDQRTTNAGFIIPFRAYRTLRRLQRKRENPEDGVVDEKTAPFMIAYNNPLHLIRTIIQNSRGFGTPPLVGWVDYFEGNPLLRTSDWSPFESIRNKVFWVQKQNVKTLRTILEQNGYILHYDMRPPYPNVQELKCLGNPLFRPNPEAVARMEIDGTHWSEYFAERYKYLAPQEAIEELRQITLNSRRFEDALARLPSTPAVDTIRKLAQSSLAAKSHRIGQYELFEEPAGWFRKTDRQASPRLAADVRCYIDRVIVDPRGTKKFYRGRIVYGEQIVNFRVRTSNFDQNAIECIRSILRKSNYPEPTFQCKNRFYKAAVFALSKMKKVRSKQ